MLSLWGLDGDRATDGGGRPDMTTRGVDAVLAHLAKLPPQESLTLAEQRAQYERAERAFPVPADVTVERVTAPVAPAEWLAPPSARADIVVLYLHGGGYVIGSPRSHRHLAAAIARAARARALVLDYRLAPEHPFPAALEDAVAAYRWLLAQGQAPASLVIAGDSAGGGRGAARDRAPNGPRLALVPAHARRGPDRRRRDRRVRQRARRVTFDPRAARRAGAGCGVACRTAPVSAYGGA